jgi:ABC-type nitrate/sulfonate/bicarbonate transport system ATPase subunit
VDEAVLLADRIMLMNAAPRARVSRDRAQHHAALTASAPRYHDPTYYPIRNHLWIFW